MALLPYADIYLDNGQPYHNGYGDIYYNPAHGLEETEHVFIAGNHLRERFPTIKRDFVIGEVGFGSGLNFIHTADVFLQTAPASARLHFISFENNPLWREMFAELQKDRPRPEISAEIINQYPDNHAGHHLLKVHPRIHLHLLWGDIRETLPELRAKVEAWFLDGFAPAKNPVCWQENILQEIARCSAPQATAATFSAARVVRDGLEKAGFAVEKRKGFGRKREMITAKLVNPPPAEKHWRNQPTAPAGKIAIIGGGIAAATTARALAESGREVVIFQDVDQRAASEVPVAVPYLQPDRKNCPILRYQLNAWHHAMRSLLPHLGDSFERCGMERIPLNNVEKQRHAEQIAAQLLNEKSHFLTENGHLHYPQAGLIYMLSLLPELKTHPNIVNYARKINHLDELKDFSATILCTGWQSTLNPEPLLQHAIRPLRGQGTIFHSNASLAHVLCDSRTLIPMEDNDIYSGASFQPNCADLTAREEDDEENKQALLAKIGGEVQKINHFVGIRGAARDYLPLVGAIPEKESVCAAYGQYRYNAKAKIAAEIGFHTGLYQHQALGSKGCTYSWLNADFLTAVINGTPLPLPAEQIDIIAPARFFIRDLKRNQLN